VYTRIIDKLGWILAALVSLAALAALAGLASAGPLDPSAPPGSTDRTVITSLPYTISQPGSYIFNRNLSCAACAADATGISVNASNVTIDLRGFELVGGAGGLAQAIVSSGTYSNISVSNGTIRGWSWNAIIITGSAQIENMRVIGNGGFGITVGAGSLVTETTAAGNGRTEIAASDRSVLENCVADGSATSGSGIEVGADSIVRACVATNNGNSTLCCSDEITAGDRSLIEDCIADGWTGSVRGPGNGLSVGNASVVRGCNVANNAGIGMAVFGTNNRIETNHVRANNSYGYYVSGDHNVFVQNDSALNRGNTPDDNCYLASGGNDFVIKTDATAAGAFDNICD